MDQVPAAALRRAPRREVDGWGVVADDAATEAGVAFVLEPCLTGREGLSPSPLANEVPLRRDGAVTRRDGLLELAAVRPFLPGGPFMP